MTPYMDMKLLAESCERGRLEAQRKLDAAKAYGASLERKVKELLAAPVVERQPVPDYFVQACDKFDWTPEEALKFYAEGKHFDTEGGRTRILCTGAIASYALKTAGGDYAHMKGAEPTENPVFGYADSYRQMERTGTKSIDIWSIITDLERNIAPLFTAPPELAELKATIAKLNSELTTARQKITAMDHDFDVWDVDMKALRAELERLKGGQGEPVAYMYREQSRSGTTWTDWCPVKKLPEWSGISESKPLYTSQPAPVAVLLPERTGLNFHGFRAPYDSGWNACLDKVKELNP